MNDNARRRAIDRLRSLGLLSGVAGVVSTLFFLAARLAEGPAADPTSPSVFSQANDLTTIVAMLALIPVSFILWQLLPQDGRLWRWTVLASAAMALLALSAMLMLTDAIDFQVQGATAVICVAAVFRWVLLVSRRALLLPGESQALWRGGVVLGLTVIIGMLIAAAGLLMPMGSTWQYLLIAMGGVPAVLCWLALPVWTIVLARRAFVSVATVTQHMRRTPDLRRRPEIAA
ncbi:hypothetical protein [Diaminobutyricimonas sp. TR449]|uniref:hypothetical protein n=1 Tax=Diaminobutyricimonas sp. TR449 TaxID=2708076 RepID=UPI00141DF526|nr:hypothetical protein [Diaminobutyricimonas sp. TR449]